MHVALAADEGYFPGLACAIFSIVLAADRSQGMEFHVMDGGIADGSWDMLTRKIAALDPGIRFHRHSIALTTFAGLPDAACGGPMTYARLLMESIIAADQVIYVDSDFLCFRNLRALWDEPMGNHLIAACQDRGVKFLRDDPVCYLGEEDAAKPYFNAGLLKANLKAWRQERVQAQTLALLRDHGARCLWWDQSALNAICKGRVQWLDPASNQYYVQEVTLPDLADGRVNIHFAAKTKPWQRPDSKTIDSVHASLPELAGRQINIRLAGKIWSWRKPEGKLFASVIWRVYYRRFNGEADGALALLNAFGAPIIALLHAACACLAAVCGNEAAPVRWIKRRISRIRILRWVLKRSIPPAAARTKSHLADS